MKTPIKDSVDATVSHYLQTKGRYPTSIHLTLKDLLAFSDELRYVSCNVVRKGPYPTCPHCGESLLEYDGMTVNLIKDGTVVVG